MFFWVNGCLKIQQTKRQRKKEAALWLAETFQQHTLQQVVKDGGRTVHQYPSGPPVCCPLTLSFFSSFTVLSATFTSFFQYFSSSYDFTFNFFFSSFSRPLIQVCPAQDFTVQDCPTETMLCQCNGSCVLLRPYCHYTVTTYWLNLNISINAVIYVYHLVCHTRYCYQ